MKIYFLYIRPCILFLCNLRCSILIYDLYVLLYKHVIADIFIVSTILFRLDNLKGTFILDVEGMCCVMLRHLRLRSVAEESCAYMYHYVSTLAYYKHTYSEI